ncbi:transcription/translation regulatory transformer protein RfaH [Aliidiomarina shirensis]|uniref:Transcription antitermination protein RfaH n=1 Tax=Aliidiomarina shirensis TaxID=1048642 RepID=A0A432WU70_9GAMM|nr:transcription/translation regulatory transformer protein RfaH [Aliidiomarina shirensis]RUO37312.1 transcription/translation regulatory transformer protein RfaH [Aliidiomarina shirensis]
MESWYLLHCKAQEVTRAEWHLANQGFDTFCPRWKIQKRLRGKKQAVLEPLFPNYLFIHIDLAHDNYTALRSTRGVSGFVRFGGYPAKVPASVVALLKERTQCYEDAQGVSNCESLYKTGTKVEITTGPFSGLQAVYDIADSETRCFVLIDMLGKQQRISVDEMDILKVS